LPQKCAYILQRPCDGGLMRSVTVRLNAAEFSAAMNTIAEWLEANRYEPAGYKYDHDSDAIPSPSTSRGKWRRRRSRRASTVPVTYLPPASPDSSRQLSQEPQPSRLRGAPQQHRQRAWISLT
jgi:hypothetical protein